MYPINERLCRLCLSLEIVPKDEGSKHFYEALHRRVFKLIDASYVLSEELELSIQRRRNSGPAHALSRELQGKGGKSEKLSKDTATPLVYRLHGFVQTESSDWVLAPRESRGYIDFESAFEVVPKRIRDRIHELGQHRPAQLADYLRRAIAYLEGGPAPRDPPWNEPYEFERGHEFILMFLDYAKQASTDITLAAVDFYITASIGRKIFLDGLNRGVRVRFLVFDFVHGDAIHVAHMVGRSTDVLYAFGNDTVEGLLWLREEARRAGVDRNFEVRLLDRDLQGRWYLIDTLNTCAQAAKPYGFTAPRASAKSMNASGGFEVKPEIVNGYAKEVDALWKDARVLEDWLPDYEAWRARPDIKAILGAQ
jgi:hypothetical protein